MIRFSFILIYALTVAFSGAHAQSLKISQLPILLNSDVNTNDVLPIVDTNVATTKKISVGELDQRWSIGQASLPAGQIFVGNLSGLPQARTMTGDASINASGDLSLSNTGVSAGTYSRVTVNAKGRVTSGAVSQDLSIVSGSLSPHNGGTGQTSYTKGDLLVASGSGTLSKVPVGSDGSYLSASSAELSGVKWLPIKSPTVTTLNTGSGTYNVPSGVLYLSVYMYGGGGGGSGSGNSGAGNGGAGNNTTLGSILSANGGAGGIYSGYGGAGGTISITGSGIIDFSSALGNVGQSSISATTGGSGAPSAIVGSYGYGGVGSANGGAGNNGGGGGGAAGGSTSGSGGGSGGYISVIIPRTASAFATSYSYVVGSGGSAGTAGVSGNNGSAGGNGKIIIVEYYQ